MLTQGVHTAITGFKDLTKPGYQLHNTTSKKIQRYEMSTAFYTFL
jgi:hypothetical protein